MSTSIKYDYEPLLSVVTFRDLHKKNALASKKKYTIHSLIFGLILGALPLFAGLMILLSMGESLTQKSLANSLVVIFGISILIVAIVFVVRFFSFGMFNRELKEAIRLDRFALANNMSRVTGSVDHLKQKEPGFVFNIDGTYAGSEDGVATHSDNPVKIANYIINLRQGAAFNVYELMAATITLDRELPQVFFDASANNTMGINRSSLSLAYKSSQKLLVSSEFDKVFSVYVADGFEQDALYFLTPELMERMMQHGSLFDFEVVKNRLYMYMPRHMLFSYESMQYLMSLTHYFQAEFSDNIKRYNFVKNDKQSSALSQSEVHHVARTINGRTGLLFVIGLLIAVLLYMIISNMSTIE